MNRRLLRDGFESYLEIEDAGGEEYEYQMLLVNRIDPILPVNIMTVNEKRKLIYSASGYRTLENRLEKMPVEGFQVRNVLEAVLNGIDGIKRYLLSPNNLILASDCLFVESDYSRIGLVYVPGYNKDVIEQLRDLIECLIGKINSADMGSVMFAWRLYSLIKEEHISIREIRKILDNYKAGGSMPPAVLDEIEEQPIYTEVAGREKKKRWEWNKNLPFILCGVFLIFLLIGEVTMLFLSYTGGITIWKRNLLLMDTLLLAAGIGVFAVLWKREKMLQMFQELSKKARDQGLFS